MMKNLVNHMVVTTFMLAAMLLVAGPAFAAETAEVGKAAPAFSLPDEDGTAHSLADYKGKVVVLEWTNPQCPFVERHYEEGTMEELAKSYADKDVVWFAVNSSHFNKPEDSKAWMKQEGFDYHTLQDPGGEVGKTYGARTTPHMFVIDKEGTLIYDGAIDDDAWGKAETRTNYVKQAVDAALAGDKPSVSTTKPYGCSVKYANK